MTISAQLPSQARLSGGRRRIWLRSQPQKPLSRLRLDLDPCNGWRFKKIGHFPAGACSAAKDHVEVRLGGTGSVVTDIVIRSKRPRSAKGRDHGKQWT
jgi:hypothetical protein